MSRKTSDNAKATIITLVLVIGLKLIDGLPWWSFTAPVVIFGIISAVKKWKVAGFGVGFLCGFAVWFGGNLYFDITLKTNILSKIGILFSVSGIIVIFISGLIGGALTGLALYTGRCIILQKEPGLTS